MRIHVVQKGETFESIAKKYGISLEQLSQLNRHLDIRHELIPKMKVKVPLENSQETRDTQESPSQADISPQFEYFLPHNPSNPRVIPRIIEDEYVISDKILTSLEDDQEDEFIQQFLPNPVDQWYPQVPVSYEYPVHTMTPYVMDYRYHAPAYSNSYYPYFRQEDYYQPYYYGNYYNPCGCGGYYHTF